MKRFSFKMLAVMSAVCAFCWLGCGGGDNGNPADNSGNNNGGDANHDGRLINAANEVWVDASVSCASPRDGQDGTIFASNGDVFGLDYRDRDGGVWVKKNGVWSWLTDGNKLIVDGKSYQYEMSNGTLTIIRDSDGKRETSKKCTGVTIVGQ